jgi:glycosyltransferase involved in cell wall biosynthesis
MGTPRFVYVLPVHNEAGILAAKVEWIATYLEPLAGSEVFLVENGSVDDSWAIAQTLERDAPIAVRAFKEDEAGIGYAYHRGLVEAIARFGPSTDHWAVMTAADLPFGSTDIEAARADLEGGAVSARMVMGSKAHPGSMTNSSFRRSVMTNVYRAGRRLVLGMRVGDSQGSMFIRLDLAAEIVPDVEARGFFYSTEFCHRVERSGERIHEVPVIVEPEVRPSTVRPLKHGSEMALQLWELRQKTKPGARTP